MFGYSLTCLREAALQPSWGRASLEVGRENVEAPWSGAVGWGLRRREARAPGVEGAEGKAVGGAIREPAGDDGVMSLPCGETKQEIRVAVGARSAHGQCRAGPGQSRYQPEPGSARALGPVFILAPAHWHCISLLYSPSRF